MEKQKIIIAGGSGFLGQHLTRHLEGKGFEIKLLSRSKNQGKYLKWDAKNLDDWAEALEGAYALINMAGRTVDCRYNEKNKAQILNSRIDSTKVLGEAVKACQYPPKFWFNSSTATIYQHTPGDLPANTEVEGILGDDFSMNVAKAWEREFFSHETPHTLKTALRTAIVLGKDGGAFPVIYKLAKYGLCSPQGNGQQWFSWLHVDDFCAILDFLMQHPLAGVVNLCAPDPRTNTQFNQLLRQYAKPLFVLPQPKWILEIGAFLLRTETELILKSRKVYPAHLLDAGFQFQYSTLEQALKALVKSE